MSLTESKWRDCSTRASVLGVAATLTPALSPLKGEG